MKPLVVITTTDNRELAETISREAIEKRLAACVQIVGPITSVYRWQGEIETGEEYRCELKTCEPHLPELEALIRELHSYEVPEVIAVPIVHISTSYRNWLQNELKET